MVLTRVQKFILYTLGIWYEEANKRLRDKPVEIAVSKGVFIDLVKKAKIVEKQERALYKNLEVLEAKRLISYTNKDLALTERGKKHFLQLSTELHPYLYVGRLLREKDPLSYSKKVQTVFSRENESKE